MLFIIYINDIAQSSRKFDFITYADDTPLCGTLDGVTAVADINTALKNITEWLEINKLSLNVKNPKAMVFHMPQKQIIPPNLKINDTTIEFVDNFVFLGVTINNHLNWSNHVDKTANQISKTIGMLNNLKKPIPSNILRILYNSLILPHLNYGILAWGRKIKRLEIIQKRAVRILAASKYNAHTSHTSDMYKIQEIKLYYKLVHKQLPKYFLNFQCNTNSDLHCHNTRSRHKLHTPQIKHDFAKNNVRYSIINTTINNLPESVLEKIHTHSLKGVATYAKKYFIDNYETVTTESVTYVDQIYATYFKIETKKREH